MSRSVAILLGEILDAIELIGRYATDLRFHEFTLNLEKQDAIVRRLIVIGQAVKGIPDEVRDRYPEIPWRSIAAARDVLVHEYFRVDLELAWEMVQDDLPMLARQLREVIRLEGPEE